VQRLMRLMGIAALGPKPKTTTPAPGHKSYPYLLRDMTIERANHVWACAIRAKAVLPVIGDLKYLTLQLSLPVDVPNFDEHQCGGNLA
jgi:hypothetical protein